ncbi:CidA/LrgA family protein [Sulfitobacter sp. SH22]|uniref:CidA/LrgA family protein n=1 Tax=Sulfitobacter sp. SH22 TaxID=3421172 RepID=UPI003F50A654
MGMNGGALGGNGPLAFRGRGRFRNNCRNCAVERYRGGEKPKSHSAPEEVMIGYLTIILVCQLVGELIVGTLSISIPGPVLGMLILFLLLLIRGDLPAGLGQTADGLLRAMSLLFVPAGTGVMMHFKLLGEALLPLGAALVVSTAMTITVTALMMRWLKKAEADE